MEGNKGKTLLDLESYQLDGCTPLRPSIDGGRGRKRVWLVECVCGTVFKMTVGQMGYSRSPKRRWAVYSCGCKRK